jgi:ubiquinone/menaquinone biosynthesis C-methylase UbiE
MQGTNFDKTTSLKYLVHLASLGATDLHPQGRAATFCLLKALALHEGQRVLEIGCGTAHTATLLASTCRVLIDGVDLLPEMLRVARWRVKLARVENRVRLLQASSDALPIRSGIYDRVYAESALGFLPAGAAQAMLAEIHRVLKPMGLFVANESIWKRDVPPELVSAIYAGCLQDFGLCQAFEKAWSASHWLHLMTDMGFEIVSSDLLKAGDEPHNPQNQRALRGFDRRGSPPFDSTAEPPPARLILSDLLTLCYRARGWFSPKLIKQRAIFRELLRKHRNEGQYVESRLFVLRRPLANDRP